MKKILHFFFPNKKNRYHPHILRSYGLVSVAVILAFIPSLYNTLSTGSSQVLGYATSISISELFSLSNSERTSVGLPAYSLNSTLNQAASAKASNMFEDDYWAHDNPDGTTPWYFIEAAGYSYQSAGENLAKGFNTSAGVVNGWMNSAPHKANVIDADFVDVGYSVMNGVLQGEETTLVVAMYGLPYVAPEPTPVAPTQTTPTPSPPATSPTPEPTTPTTTPVVSEEPAEPTTEPTKEPADDPAPVASPTKNSSSTKEDASENGQVKSALVINPVELYSGMNWGQKTSLFILSVLLLLFILKHTLVWRAQRNGVKGVWMRAHPVGQVSVIVVAMVVTIMSGVGSVI
jgi:uncharacterized protein YkwD